MNNKGFTLVELLASVVILALILAIAIPGINNISSSIRAGQRKNKISEIEIAAARYAYDTGETLIFVDKLINSGYIETDDENENISDPVNNGRLNCYLVEMEKEGNYYRAKFIDDKDYDNNGVCDLNKLNEMNEEIKIEVQSTETAVNNWLKGSVTLTAITNNSSLNIDCKTNNCTWNSSSGAYKTGSSSINIENSNGILDTRYTFQMTVYDSDNTIKRYTASTDLKIDNDAPIIYPNEIKITNRFINTDSKTVTIEASDGKGSGIKEYYLGLKTSELSCNQSLTYTTSNTFVVNKKGTYLICVKDNVGNVSSYDNLIINYLPN